MDDGAEDGIECDVQMLAEVLGKEAQDKAAVLLEQRILATVAAVGGGIGQVLRAVDLDGDLQLRAEQVDLDADDLNFLSKHSKHTIKSKV